MGLKTLILDQMLNRLPISLAQLKAEIVLKNIKMKSGNSCTLSKKLTKTIYNNLINTIEKWEQSL